MIILNILADVSPWLLAFFASGVGGFFGAYFSQKGKNLATKSDIEEITSKVEMIKASVGNETHFLRQDRDLERSAIHALLKNYHEGFIAEMVLGKNLAETGGTIYDEQHKKESNKWYEKIDEFQFLYTEHYLYLKSDVGNIAKSMNLEISDFYESLFLGLGPDNCEGAAIFTRKRKEELEKAIRHRLDHFAEKP